MTVLIVGLVIFLGVHSVGIFAPAWREAQIVRLGPGPWKGLYSVVSAIGLGVLIYGFGVARQAPVVLYTPPTALRHIAVLLMVPVFPLFIAAYLPGRIKAAAKHPMLLSVKFWAVAHLLANGTLADVVLFGSFLLWAGADRIAVKRRPVPRVVPGAPASAANDAIVVIAGISIYLLFLLWAHRVLIGVSPLG
ncbi:MAG: NnrU family protein [Proteobacteria bacterium]|nr:NnrU family protein [Pseudomonadota bacterium]